MIHTNELMYMSLCFTPWADNLHLTSSAKCKTLFMLRSGRGLTVGGPGCSCTSMIIHGGRSTLGVTSAVGPAFFSLDTTSPKWCDGCGYAGSPTRYSKQYVCLKEYWTWLMSMAAITLDTTEITSDVFTVWWEGPPRGGRQLRPARPHACVTLKFSLFFILQCL